MDIKTLSREEWDAHPAVELVCQGYNGTAPIYCLKTGWYYGALGIPVLKDGSVCIDLFNDVYCVCFICVYDVLMIRLLVVFVVLMLFV